MCFTVYILYVYIKLIILIFYETVWNVLCIHDAVLSTAFNNIDCSCPKIYELIFFILNKSNSYCPVNLINVSAVFIYTKFCRNKGAKWDPYWTEKGLLGLSESSVMFIRTGNSRSQLTIQTAHTHTTSSRKNTKSVTISYKNNFTISCVYYPWLECQETNCTWYFVVNSNSYKLNTFCGVLL